MTEPEAKLSLAPGFRLQWEEAQTADVLLFPEGMVKLSDSAAAILKQCDGKSSEQVVAALQAQFPDADLRDDVLAFLDDALSKGWIRAE